MSGDANNDGKLDLGEAWIYNATYQVTQADLNAGQPIVNTVAVTSTEVTTPVTDDATTTVTQQAEITLEKSASALADTNGDGVVGGVGDTIAYSFRVENTGNTPLNNVTINDGLAGIVLSGGPIPTLAVGAVDTTTFAATYAIKQSDIDAGGVTNQATVSGTPPATQGNPNPAAVSDVSDDPSTLNAADDPTVVVINARRSITLQKSVRTVEDVNSNGVSDAGDVIHWTFRIQNSGNVTLTNVTVDDQLAGVKVLGQPIARLAPGAVDSSTYTASYEITAADVAAGKVDNVAVATGAPAATPQNPNPAQVVSQTSATTTVLEREAANLTVVKRAGVRLAKRGDVVPYAIEVTNKGQSAVTVDIVDALPPGFAYVPETGRVDGVVANPVVGGRTVRFVNVTIPAGNTVVLALQARIGSSVQPGDHVNTATAVEPGTDSPVASPGKATVRLTIEHVFDCGDVIGTVFDDVNRNGYQDEGEPGLPGVRVATVRGVLITTDKHGRFNVPCAVVPDARIGSNFIMKVDTRTLPTGYRLTTENPRVVRLTAGKLSKLNFGAAIDRVVRVDLNNQAFVKGKVQPSEALLAGIDKLVATLGKEHSVLRLTYYVQASDGKLAQARLKEVERLIRKEWRSLRGRYELGVELKVVRK